MPTGYTAAIQDDTTLREWALLCSRAMGAMILQRDDDFDAAPKEKFEPSDYHLKEIAKLEARLSDLNRMSDVDVMRAQEAETRLNEQKRAEAMANAEATRRRYQRMREMVIAWNPPGEVKGLKKFMLEQIDSSIDFDCHDSEFWDKCYPPLKVAPADIYRARVAAKIYEDLAYHKAQHAAEVERTNERNKWIADLRASLPEK